MKRELRGGLPELAHSFLAAPMSNPRCHRALDELGDLDFPASCVRGVGDQLAQEDLLVRVEGVDDQASAVLG